MFWTNLQLLRYPARKLAHAPISILAAARSHQYLRYQYMYNMYNNKFECLSALTNNIRQGQLSVSPIRLGQPKHQSWTAWSPWRLAAWAITRTTCFVPWNTWPPLQQKWQMSTTGPSIKISDCIFLHDLQSPPITNLATLTWHSNTNIHALITFLFSLPACCSSFSRFFMSTYPLIYHTLNIIPL